MMKKITTAIATTLAVIGFAVPSLAFASQVASSGSSQVSQRKVTGQRSMHKGRSVRVAKADEKKAEAKTEKKVRGKKGTAKSGTKSEAATTPAPATTQAPAPSNP